MNVMYLFSSIVTVVLFGLYILLVAYGIYSSAILFFPDCRYQRGQWSDCDPQLQLKKRTDTIKAHFKGPDCQENRLITKQCNSDARKGG